MLFSAWSTGGTAIATSLSLTRTALRARRM